MRLGRAIALLAAALFVSALVGPTSAVSAQDTDRSIADGGIMIAGWQGEIDARAAQQGMSISDSRIAMDGEAIHVLTGPASSFWNPSNTASGNYSVSATFREPEQIFDHPHPFGIFIGGKNLGTDQQQLTYCTAYRNGTFIVRQFNGMNVTNLVPTGRNTQPNAAVHTVAAIDQPVVQEIGWNVHDGQADCVINGQVVATLTAAQLGGPDATNGVYGLRVAHNVEVVVTGFGTN